MTTLFLKAFHLYRGNFLTLVGVGVLLALANIAMFLSSQGMIRILFFIITILLEIFLFTLIAGIAAASTQEMKIGPFYSMAKKKMASLFKIYLLDLLAFFLGLLFLAAIVTLSSLMRKSILFTAGIDIVTSALIIFFYLTLFMTLVTEYTGLKVLKVVPQYAYSKAAVFVIVLLACIFTPKLLTYIVWKNVLHTTWFSHFAIVLIGNPLTSGEFFAILTVIGLCIRQIINAYFYIVLTCEYTGTLDHLHKFCTKMPR